MKKYSIVAFDLDGTLTDPARGLIASFEYALGKMGIDYGEPEGLKRFIGPPIYEEWQKYYGITPEESSRTLEYFHEFYSVYGWWDDTVYDGIHEMLSALKAAGKKIVLATSKPEHFAKKILNLFDLTKYFDFIGGASSDKERDKKWEVLEYSLTSLGAANRDECVMVGDRMYDAEGAKICGIDSIGVTYGHGSREELLGAGFDYIVDTPADVTKIII